MGDSSLKSVIKDMGFKNLYCCGLSEASGLSALQTVEDVYALRRAVGHGKEDEDREEEPHAIAACSCGDDCCDDTEDITTSVVLVTTVPNQEKAIKLLSEGGFKALCQFHNENSSNEVTLWAALTL